MTGQFVILKHNHPHLHWDLLLEDVESARSWRLLRKPCLGEPIAAEPLPAHRLLYLDYEGPVSNDRGAVERFVHGQYELVHSDKTLLALRLCKNDFATSVCISTLSDGRVFVVFDAIE